MKAAIKKVPSLSEKRVTPHLFRHTTAVHLVAAGVDVTVIRSWLGHADLETTNHYAQANFETKRKALEQADPKLRPAKPPRWNRDADLLRSHTIPAAIDSPSDEMLRVNRCFA